MNTNQYQSDFSPAFWLATTPTRGAKALPSPANARTLLYPLLIGVLLAGTFLLQWNVFNIH